MNRRPARTASPRGAGCQRGRSRPLAVHPSRTTIGQAQPFPGRQGTESLLALLGLVQVALGDRLLLALLGYHRPGDQVHERARPDAEDREHSEHQADDVGVDAEVLTDPGANPGDHAAVARPDQLLAFTHSVHTPDHALPGCTQTAGPRPHTLKSGPPSRAATERTHRCRVPPPSQPALTCSRSTTS